MRVYARYLELPPLDIMSMKDEVALPTWKADKRLSATEFSRIMALFQERGSLMHLTGGRRDFDLDNLHPVLYALHLSDCLSITTDGVLRIDGIPTPHRFRPMPQAPGVLKHPKATFNQFPCTNHARKRRVERLLADFPHVISMSVGLLGDDDLLSLELAYQGPFIPIVLDADESLLRYIRELATLTGVAVETHTVDFSRAAPIPVSFDSFFTDPPYSYAGVYSFMHHGLRCLSTRDYVYVVANQMMMGSRQMLEIFRALTEVGVYPTMISPSASDYDLPLNYRERTDFLESLERLGYPLTMFPPSSSSSEIVFDTRNMEVGGIPYLDAPNLYPRSG
jgi:hypothetical protein